jgi:20S proteasome alpha/beta subunit
MTVVAWDGKTLACDSQISDGSFNVANVKKIKKVDGWLIGGAGDLDLNTLFLDTFTPKPILLGKHIQPLTVSGRNEDFEGIIISPKKIVYYLETSGIVTKLGKVPFMAIGCGTSIAMTALDLGADARTAVKLAIKYRQGCGGKIHTLKL